MNPITIQETVYIWASTLYKHNIFGLFQTVTNNVYLDMLREFFIPILEEHSPNDMLFEQVFTFPQGRGDCLK